MYYAEVEYVSALVACFQCFRLGNISDEMYANSLVGVAEGTEDACLYLKYYFIPTKQDRYSAVYPVSVIESISKVSLEMKMPYRTVYSGTGCKPESNSF